MAALGGVLVFVGWALSAVGGTLVLVTAFKQDVTKGLLAFFVPFYIFYFVYTNWEECRKGFLLSIGGIILSVGGGLMVGVGAATG